MESQKPGQEKKWSVRHKYVILIVILILIIGLDQLTKWWITQEFTLGMTIPVIRDFFNLTYVQNQGAAFGLLAQAHPSFRVPFFIIVPFLALGSIGYIFRRLPHDDSFMAIAFSLVISGAIGNLIDRLLLGYVVDFLDFHWKWAYHFPAFNVADSAICVGVGMLMLDLFLQERKAEKSNASRTL